MLSELYGLNTKLESVLAKSAWPVEFTAELAAFVLLLCFIGLTGLENRHPKIRRKPAQNQQSYRTNVGLFLFNSVMLSSCSASLLFIIAERYSGYGLLNYVENPVMKTLLAFVSIDLLLYGWHRLCHKYDTLWVLHRVHHNDPYLNVSTAFRLHFVEILLTNVLKALVIIGMGIDKILVLAVETLVTLSIMFHHANISFFGERVASKLIIVPYLHRLHHSIERVEHDTNFGAVLSVWDRLFKTYREGEPETIGIKGNSPLEIFGLIKFGFGLNPVPASHHTHTPANIEAMIAEAAYYRAQERNFTPGDDQGDWYAAKADILRQFAQNNRQKNQWLKGLILNHPMRIKNFWQFDF